MSVRRRPALVLGLLGATALTACLSTSRVHTLVARGLAAGLTPAQIDTIAGFGFPVLVPAGTDGLRLIDFGVAQVPIGEDFVGAYYDLHYQRDDGACVWVTGANEGIGSPPWEEIELPPVAIPALGREVRMLEDTFGPPAADGGPGVRAVGWIDLGRGGMHVSVQSRDDTAPGCRPMEAEGLAAFVASLRPIDPDDDGRLGGG